MKVCDIARVLERHFVRDDEIQYVAIDSRLVYSPKTTLFFAIKGSNFDGHDYIQELYGAGVRNFVVNKHCFEGHNISDANVFIVNDVIIAMQTLAEWWRKTLDVKILAITGSNGKTIVKEWIYQLLSSDDGIYRSPRSYNSQIGVALSLLGMNHKTHLAIIEAGISKPHEMERLQRMIAPNVGIFTNIGDAHGENFNSMQQKLSEKAILFNNCDMIIGESPCAEQTLGHSTEVMSYLRFMKKNHTQIFSWGYTDDSDLHITRNKIEGKFRILNINYLGEERELKLPFIDDVSLQNAMNAIAFVLSEGKSLDYIIDKAYYLTPVAMRMDIRDGCNNCILINDYYNSDLQSFRHALLVLGQQNATHRKRVILSDFFDTGLNNERLYSEVAKYLKTANIDVLVGIGTNLMKFRELFSAFESSFYENTDIFLNNITREDFKDEVILLKGSRSFKFEYISSFLQKKLHRTELIVDLDAMTRNLNYFRSLVPASTKFAAMVKAESYGCGMIEASLMLQSKGIDYLMVAFADEGVELRAAGVNVPIAIMNPDISTFDKIIEFDLEPEIYSLELLKDFINAVIRHGIEHYPIHLKLNTGMNRSGLDPDDINQVLDNLKDNHTIAIRSMFSHLAASDEEKHDNYTKQQIERFEQMTQQIQNNIPYYINKHILNSAGIERFSKYAYDMVRIGIGLYGISSINTHLEAVSTFRTYVNSLRKLKAGETIGYGRLGALERDSLIAVLPVGYADGLNRHLGQGQMSLMLKGIRVPIIGNICMDACMVDVTDVDNVCVGDEVEIFGKNIPATELADKLQTIVYEVFTSVSTRVPRVYIRE